MGMHSQGAEVSMVNWLRFDERLALRLHRASERGGVHLRTSTGVYNECMHQGDQNRSSVGKRGIVIEVRGRGCREDCKRKCGIVVSLRLLLQAQESIGSNKKSVQGSNEDGGIERDVVIRVWRIKVQELVENCIIKEVASDTAETREVHAVCSLGVVLTDSSPAVRNTKADGVSVIVARVDDGRVDRLSCKVLECTLVGTRGLAVDLDLITTIEGCDPIIWPRCEGDTAGDANIGTSVVDGELASGNCLAVVAADLGPLEDVDTIGDP